MPLLLSLIDFNSRFNYKHDNPIGVKYDHEKFKRIVPCFVNYPHLAFT